MFIINLAEINIGINCRYPQLKHFCREYIYNSDTVDFCVSVTDEDIEAERSKSTETHSDAYLESLCVYRKICKKLPEYGAFLLHSSVVECDGIAYAFAAPSGTGKSTHTSLWLKHFGDRARIINGDKPILRFKNGKIYVYGTPWCGKEGYNINTDAPLASLCFLERGKQNVIKKLDAATALMRLIGQILLPDDEASIDLLFPLLDEMLATVPCFLLSCNISDEAVTVAYNEMTKGNSLL